MEPPTVACARKFRFSVRGIMLWFIAFACALAALLWIDSTLFRPSLASPHEVDDLIVILNARPRAHSSFFRNARIDAANRLGEIGPAASAAIPALKSVRQKEKDPKVVAVIDTALTKIETRKSGLAWRYRIPIPAGK
jgi:hypothetical protein